MCNFTEKNIEKAETLRSEWDKRLAVPENYTFQNSSLKNSEVQSPVKASLSFRQRFSASQSDGTH